MGQNYRNPLASVIRLRFTPCFPLSVGLRHVFLFLTAVIWSYSRPSTTMTSQCRPEFAGKQAVLQEAPEEARIALFLDASECRTR